MFICFDWSQCHNANHKFAIVFKSVAMARNWNSIATWDNTLPTHNWPIDFSTHTHTHVRLQFSININRKKKSKVFDILKSKWFQLILSKGFTPINFHCCIYLYNFCIHTIPNSCISYRRLLFAHSFVRSFEANIQYVSVQ